MLAAVLMTASIPMIAGATDSTQETPQPVTEGAANVPEGAEGTGENSEGSTQGTEQNAPGDVTEGTGDQTTTGDQTPSGDGTASGTDEDKKDGESSDEKEDEKDETKDNQVESDNVVTLGENLTEAQRASMYEYFGTSADKVRTIVVTHADEVKYMEGIATAEQIGPTTNSCAYVEPTTSGGIKVKTANLNFVTSAMIASTLLTAGMENCNVIAACPFEVSGTGALTGIMMAYETASGESLDEGKKEAAMEELITTGNLADTIGQEKAAEVMNDVKTEIIDKGLTDPAEIGEAVDQIAGKYEVTLTDEQKQQIVALMEKISQYDYNVKALKNTLDNLTGEDGFFSKMWTSIKSFFVGSGDGILSETNEEALGSDVITDSTESESGFKDGLWTRIKKFFSGSDE